MKIFSRIPFLKKTLLYAGKLLLIIILAVSFKSFIAEIYSISSSSMFPTITPVEYVWVNKFSYRLQSPEYFPLTNIPIPSFSCEGLKDVQREDLVMFKPPRYSKGERTPWREPFVKRCAALPGDIIEIKDGKTYINGKIRKAYIQNYYDRTLNLNTRIPAKGDTLHPTKNTNIMLLDVMRYEGHDIKTEGNGILVDGKLSHIYI